MTTTLLPDDRQLGEPAGTAGVTAAPSAMTLAFRDFAPFAVSLIPFALAIGSAAALSGLTLLEASFGAIGLIGGTAQLAANDLIGSGSGVAAVLTTVLVINSRFVIYSAGLARWFADATLRDRLLLAFPLVDQSFLCCEERFVTMRSLSDRRCYYLTGTATLIAAFFTGELVGYLAGPVVPSWLGLQLAAPLAFAAMLMKSIKTSDHAVAAVAAAVTVVVLAGLPGGLGLPLAILTGVFAGTRVAYSKGLRS